MTRRPNVATSRDELVALLSVARGAGRRVALVPTMGALHDGHASLMTRARAEVGEGPVVVSIFVNPLQFALGEDLDRYPRTMDADLDLCAAQGVDVVFAPSVEEMYPAGEPAVTVDPGALGTVLEGRTRPTHFRGMLTVVAKLFGLVHPDVAVFGEKDYQQLVLVRRMSTDLSLGAEVVGAETLREPDGLAMSSRNRYLDAEQRRQAQVLSRSLYAARAAAGDGVRAALDAARIELDKAPDLELDYLVFTDADLGDLPAEVRTGSGGAGYSARVLVEARLGSTRLIDNLAVQLGSPEENP